MRPWWAMLGEWLVAHWGTLLACALVGIIAYLVGLANPLYCSRCRKIMTAEEAWRQKFHRDRHG